MFKIIFTLMNITVTFYGYSQILLQVKDVEYALYFFETVKMNVTPHQTT
jgi:hypothetical protein